jgi:hypothetical protein
MSGTLRTAAGSDEFLAGLGMGVVALVAGLLLALATRWRPVPTPGPVPVHGLLFAAAFVAGLALAPGPAVPGWPPPSGWVLPAAAAVALAAGPLLAGFDARWPSRGLGPVLLAIALAGIWSTVPDTEAALVALGAALPLALLGWPRPLGSLGRAGSWAAAGALGWVVATGGAGRPSAVVGGAACLGLLAVEPLARRLDPERRSLLGCVPGGPWGAVVVAAAQLGLVYVAARVAGTRPTVAAAVAVAGAELAAGVGLALGVTAAGARRGWCTWCTDGTSSGRWASRPTGRTVQGRTSISPNDQEAC